VPYTLLLADDSVTIQRVIELTFAEEDVDVVAVSDGDQAIQRLESAPPDIVLADVGMPGRDGYEVARYVRQSPKLAHIPVVLLTGAFEPVDQVRAAEVGCDGVLAKPFEPQLVIGRVKELLTGRTRRAAQPSSAASAPPAGPAAPDLDEYFERLDTAFASLAGRSSAKRPEETASPVVPEPPASDDFDDIAWPAPDEPLPAADPELPLSYASPRHAFEAPATLPAGFEPETDAPLPLPVQQQPPPVQQQPQPPAPQQPEPHAAAPTPGRAETPAIDARRELPPIADAFAAILAAEQEQAGDAARPVWPGVVPVAAPPPPPEMTDEVIERIVARVLDRLSEQVTRQQVAAAVATTAEQLVREEIDRIKSSIK
jgi:CheY-like chemotaxis protein